MEGAGRNSLFTGGAGKGMDASLKVNCACTREATLGCRWHDEEEAENANHRHSSAGWNPLCGRAMHGAVAERWHDEGKPRHSCVGRNPLCGGATHGAVAERWHDEGKPPSFLRSLESIVRRNRSMDALRRLLPECRDEPF